MNSISAPKQRIRWLVTVLLMLTLYVLVFATTEVASQEMINVGSLRQELPKTQDDSKKSDAKKAEDSLLKKYSGQQDGGAVEEIPAPRRQRSELDNGNLTLDENGNPILTPTETGGAEVIRQRYPDGRIQVLRHVVQDEQSNYFNHGPWKLFNRTGQVLAEGTFVDGFMEGSWQRWHNADSNSMFGTAPFSDYEGPFLSVAYFKNGKIHGSWVVMDPNRRKIFELGYQDGKRHGVAIWWFPNGMKMRQMAFENGVLHGELIQWDKQGRIERKEQYIQGQQIVAKTRQWHTNQKRSEDYFLGPRLEVSASDDWWNAKPASYASVGGEVQHGVSLGWYRNGQPQKRGRYQKGMRTGGFTWWFVNGQKKTSGAYQNDQRSGKWIWWHENGMRAIVGSYQDGQPTGQWQWWNDDGKLIREANVDEFPEDIEKELPDPDDENSRGTGTTEDKEESILSGIRNS